MFGNKDNLEEKSKNYIIGIDLGTTNSAVAYVDLRETPVKHKGINLFKIPQLTGPSEITSSWMLPSFCYIPGPYDISPESIRLPWKTDESHFVGAFARDYGAKIPMRLVSSAKSWLCHRGADRKAKILPWGAGTEVEKISPVTASASYLKHIRLAWNRDKGDSDELLFENQTIIITVPASFDEIARDLTLEAASLAGLRNVILLEEPLAAFYSWLSTHENTWQRDIRPDELIFVCDVGGGTTDFTLIALKQNRGTSRFERIAVGDHLILGGDNIDLALAKHIEQKFGSHIRLRGDRLKTLCHLCRQCKEKILNNESDQEIITLIGEGASLIAGTLSAKIERVELENLILEGFFPLIRQEQKTPSIQRKGISEFGLPYEGDPAITRHIGQFFEHHRDNVFKHLNKEPFPDIVLFNGGTLKPKAIQNRIVQAICHWFLKSESTAPKVLENPIPEYAVAIGAAYYGLVKTGLGVRVGSGCARSYYLGFEKKDTRSEERASSVCLIERGLEEGSEVLLPDLSFEVRTNELVSFDLYSSSYRSGDMCGDIVEIDDTLTKLPPLQTVIQFGQKGIKTTIPVQIKAQYTELGVLELWCQSLSSSHQWRLLFQLRESIGTSHIQEHEIFESSVIQAAIANIDAAFQKESEPAKLERLLKTIAETVHRPKEKWPLSFIRKMADHMLDRAEFKKWSFQHEIRWLNLTGYCLRPGFGDGADEQRIKKIWKHYKQGVIFKKNPQNMSEWWILWRRLAGGLTSGQQRQIYQDIRPILLPKKSEKTKLHPQEFIEIWMALGNMERLSIRDKTELGRSLLAELKPKKAPSQLLWTLSRLGARSLLYGPLDRVIPPQEVEKWILVMLDEPWKNIKPVAAAIAQLARRTGDRFRDIDPKLVDKIIQWMVSNDLMDEIRFLESVIPIESKEETLIFGEDLPAGIILNTTPRPIEA